MIRFRYCLLLTCKKSQCISCYSLFRWMWGLLRPCMLGHLSISRSKVPVFPVKLGMSDADRDLFVSILRNPFSCIDACLQSKKSCTVLSKRPQPSHSAHQGFFGFQEITWSAWFLSTPPIRFRFDLIQFNQPFFKNYSCFKFSLYLYVYVATIFVFASGDVVIIIIIILTSIFFHE